MDKYLCVAHGPDKEKLEKTIYFAADKATKHGVHVLLIVPTLKNISNTILPSILGEKSVKKLKNKEPVFISKFNRIFIMNSLRTAKDSSWEGVTLGLWGGKEMAKLLSRQRQSKMVISLTWNSDDQNLWSDFTSI